MIGRDWRPLAGQYVPCGRSICKLGGHSFLNFFFNNSTSTLQYIKKLIVLLICMHIKLRVYSDTDHSHPYTALEKSICALMF